MPRTGPSRAEQHAISDLAERGLTVTATQLERWRRTGWLPRNRRHGLGQGRGSVSEVDEGAVRLAGAFAAAARPGRRGADIVAEVFLRADLPEAPGQPSYPSPPEPAVRTALRHVIDRQRVEAQRSSVWDAGAVDAAYEAAEQAAARLPVWHAHVIDDAHAAIAGRQVPSRRAETARARTAFQHLTVAYDHPEEVDTALLIDSLAALGMLDESQLDEAHRLVREAELRGGPTFPEHLVFSRARLQAAVDMASFDEIKRARTAAVALLALSGWVALLRFTNDDDPVVIELRTVLAHAGVGMIPGFASPATAVPFLAMLLAAPDALESVEATIAGAGDILSGQVGVLIERQLAALDAALDRASDR